MVWSGLIWSGLVSWFTGPQPFAHAFVGLAELYELLSHCDPSEQLASGSGDVQIAQPRTGSDAAIVRRVRKVESALLNQIVALDSRQGQEMFAEAHEYARQRDQRERKDAFSKRLWSVFYGGVARSIPGAVSA